MLNSIAILPAISLFGDKNPSLSQIANEWKEGTLYVVRRNGGKALRFWFSYGSADWQPGETLVAHHDQTGRKMGEFTVTDTIQLNHGVCKSYRGEQLDMNRPRRIAVFK